MMKIEFILLLSLFCACTAEDTAILSYAGKTMGTSYHVDFKGVEKPPTQFEIDSLLDTFNRAVSTYIPQSDISQFNRSDSLYCFPGRENFFTRNLEMAVALHEMTGGYFNPAVMPLLNYYGFGYTETRQTEHVEMVSVDSLLEIVDMDMLQNVGKFTDTCLFKGQTELDFSAHAKGYAVDLLAEFLEARGVENYMVEIGGELRVKGLNETGDLWKVGINPPEEGASQSDYLAILALKDKAVATSGNYRNFLEADGKKYVHIVNPFTGKAEQSSLLSASILAKDCATADALATACMAMGEERAEQMLDSLPVDYIILIATGEEIEKKMSPAVEAMLLQD